MGVFGDMHSSGDYHLFDNLLRQKKNMYEEKIQKENSAWGKRGDILNLGKPMDKMLFHRPKTISSSRQQVELLYNWFLNCEDRRTRVVGKAWFEEPMGMYLSPGYDDFLWNLVPEKPEETYRSFYLRSSPEERKKMKLDPSYVFEKVEGAEKIYRQKFFSYYRALKMMKKITEGRESQYILTNPVYSKPLELKNGGGQRTLERLTEYHTLFSEIDHYKLEKYKHLSSQQLWKKVKKHLLDKDFPLPSEVVFSRGLQMYWKHGPIPAFMSDEWKMLMKHINELLSEFGSDPVATDGVRILRAVGSIHEVTKEKITGLTFTNDRYDFMELFNKYCHEEWKQKLLQQEKERQKRVEKLQKRYEEKSRWMYENGIIDENGDFTEKYQPEKKQKRKIINDKAKNHFYTNRHQNIIDGVFWLSDNVRKGDMEGCREFSCFLVRVHVLRVTGGNTIEANRLMRELWEGFSPQKYTWEEILHHTASAEQDYKNWLKNETQSYRYSTEKLIEKLKITDEEMKKMRFIVDKERSAELKIERDRMYQQNRYKQQLKEQGKMTKKEQKEYQIQAIADYLKEHGETTNETLFKVFGEKFNVSEKTLSRRCTEARKRMK